MNITPIATPQTQHIVITTSAITSSGGDDFCTVPMKFDYTGVIMICWYDCGAKRISNMDINKRFILVKRKATNI